MILSRKTCSCIFKTASIRDERSSGDDTCTEVRSFWELECILTEVMILTLSYNDEMIRIA